MSTCRNDRVDTANGGREALDTHLYDDLRRLARARLGSERSDHTLEPTALVHEAFLRMEGNADLDWRRRTSVFARAALQMRRILVDHARRRNGPSGPGSHHRIALDERLAVELPPTLDVLAVDAALTRLAELDERRARVVELRFFGGLTIEEVAAELGVGKTAVERDWRLTRAWLARELGDDDEEDGR